MILQQDAPEDVPLSDPDDSDLDPDVVAEDEGSESESNVSSGEEESEISTGKYWKTYNVRYVPQKHVFLKSLSSQSCQKLGIVYRTFRPAT